MNGTCTMFRWLPVITLVATLATTARSVQIQDVVRLKGSETSKLVGMGLVVGLAGTGDGGKYLPTIRTLAKITQTFIDESTVPADVKDSKNVAVVYLEATIPATGVREGDHIDVHVSAAGKAKSLKGGRLVVMPMTGPMPDSPVYAWAGGRIVIEDPDTLTAGVVRHGAQLTEDVTTQLMDDMGRITLVINDEVASWPVAHNIAALINGVMTPDGPGLARAVDQKNVVVDVPMNQRSNPGTLITQILRTYIDQALISTGARVLINEGTGQIMLGADVEISPVIISAPGITITTITPQPAPTPENPLVKERHFFGLDPSQRGVTKLGRLMKALEQLQVPAADRIHIVKALHKHGSLHAQLIIE